MALVLHAFSLPLTPRDLTPQLTRIELCLKSAPVHIKPASVIGGRQHLDSIQFNPPRARALTHRLVRSP